jgi:hypothetical protein
MSQKMLALLLKFQVNCERDIKEHLKQLKVKALKKEAKLSFKDPLACSRVQDYSLWQLGSSC